MIKRILQKIKTKKKWRNWRNFVETRKKKKKKEVNMPEIFSPVKSSQLANSSEPLSELFLKFAKIFQCEMRISDLSFSMYVNIKGRKFSRSLFLAFQKN